jgi:hypothetical protein
MRKTAIGKAEVRLSNVVHTSRRTRLTVTKDELCNTSQVHSDAAEKIVIPTQADETLRGDCTLEAAEDEDRGSVWDQESYQAEECGVSLYRSVALLVQILGERTETFREVTTTRRRWLEEQAFILLGAKLYSDLTSKLGTVANEIVAVVLFHLEISLVRIDHGCYCGYRSGTSLYVVELKS